MLPNCRKEVSAETPAFHQNKITICGAVPFLLSDELWLKNIFVGLFYNFDLIGHQTNFCFLKCVLKGCMSGLETVEILTKHRREIKNLI